MKTAESPHNAKKSPKNGLVTEYFKDGSVCSVGRYADGKKTGPWKAFDTSGKLSKTTNHKAAP
jgi:antitoxin component YwqK of YwqJK toxin-antitoxin module